MVTVQYAKALPASRLSEFDAVLVVEEPLGVLLASNHAPNLTGPKGIRLDALAGMDWVSFPRSDSPVKFTAVTTDRAFALAPAGWSQPLPDTVRLVAAGGPSPRAANLGGLAR
jgi:hypothetical protein